LALTFLLVVAVAPLSTGSNLIPFTRYPFASRALLEASGPAPDWDRPYLERTEKLPWMQEREFAAISLSWAQDRFAADQFRQGRLPLWDPYTGCGLPTLDEGQFRPFNPFRIPFYLLPTAWVYSLTLLLPLFLGAAGAYRCFRGSGFSELSSAVGSGVFVLNPWMLERIATTDAPPFLLLPWAILGLRQARQNDWGSLAIAAVPFVLMAHAGHPEAALLAAGVAGAHHLACPNAPAPRGATRLLLLAEVAGLALAATAVLWVPLLKISLNAMSYREAPFRNVYPYSWVAFLAPASDCFLPAGLFALLATGAGTLWARGKFWLFLAVGATLIVFPLPGLGYALSQGIYSILGLPAYYLKHLLWTGIAFLLPLAWQSWSTAGIRHRWLAAALGLALSLGAIATCRALPLPLGVQFSFPALTMAALLFHLLPFWQAPFRGNGWKPGTGMALLVLLPLAFPLSWNHLAWNHHEGALTASARWILEKAPHQRLISLNAPYMAVPPNLGQVFGVRQGEAVAAFFPNRYLRLYHQGRTGPTLVVFDQPQLTAFRQLGATLLAVPVGSLPPNMTPLFSSDGLSLFSIPGGSGRLHFASATQEFDPSRSLSAQVMALGAGSDSVAVVERVGAPAPLAWPTAPVRPETTLLLDEPHRIEISVRNQAPGLLVLKDTWYPGWDALVDRQRVPIYRVNGCFRGLQIPAGAHFVVFQYRPWGVYGAAACSLLSTLLLLGVALRSRLKPEADRLK